LTGYAATIYVGPNEYYKTIQAGMDAMNSGDTLIIRNGRYIGASNMIDWAHRPPDGTAANYTKVKAETRGNVFIDGEDIRVPLSLEHAPTGSSYISFDGIKFGRSSGACVRIGYGNHIKFLNCAAFDSYPGDHLFSSYHSSYMLYENCWAWGHAQYAFHFRVCDHSIARRCVARIDWATTGDTYVSSFFNYESNYMEWQNCLVIDQDQDAYLDNNDAGAGGAFCFHLGNNGTINHDVAYRGCMVLNSFGSSGFLVSNQDYAITYNDCIVWDHKSNDLFYNRYHEVPQALYDHCTVGGTSLAGARGFYCSGFTGTTVRNSIVYGLTNGTALMNIESADRNCLYGNAVNVSGTTSTNTLTSTNPLSGSLKYLVRIEAGFPLDNAGTSGDIGANIVYKIGTPGALWGEPGYNTVTSMGLWPWENENLIKADMGMYNNGGVTGSRGFCSGYSRDGTQQTLTKYIWEYLGNTIPDYIYDVQNDTTPPVVPGGVSVEVTN